MMLGDGLALIGKGKHHLMSFYFLTYVLQYITSQIQTLIHELEAVNLIS